MPCGNGLMVVPAVAQLYAHGVCALFKQFGNVVGAVEYPPVVAGKGRLQYAVAHFGTIDIQCIETCHRYVSPSLRNAAMRLEFLSESGCRLGFFRLLVRYPAAAPVVLAQQTGLEECGLRLYDCAVFVFAAHPPPVAGARLQGGTCVYRQHVPGGHTPGVPDRLAIQAQRIRRHSNAICRLYGTCSAVIQPPRKTRRRIVYA